MSFEFNPRPKEDDKGIGKVHIDGAKDKSAPPASGRKKWILIGATAVVLSLGAIFALSSRKPATPDMDTLPAPQEQVDPPRNQGDQVTAPQQDISAQNIQEKESVIYRDDAVAARDKNGARVEAYLDMNGKEVKKGKDFAVHVSLFGHGGISLFVAAGPYAGARVEIFPVGAKGSRFTYTKVGEEVMRPDGQTMQFKSIPALDRFTQTVPMDAPKAAGSGVAQTNESVQFVKSVLLNNEYVHNDYAPVFQLTGLPQKDGVFTLTLENGDVYSMNFKTGEYSFDSIFLFYPNYQEDYARTGVSVDRNNIDIIKGVMPMAPKPAPTKTAAPVL